MNDRVAGLLALCVVGILGSACLGALGPQGSWEPSRWAGEKMWELVLILTGGKLALVYGHNGNGATKPPAAPAERPRVTPSGPSVAS